MTSSTLRTLTVVFGVLALLGGCSTPTNYVVVPDDEEPSVTPAQPPAPPAPSQEQEAEALARAETARLEQLVATAQTQPPLHGQARRQPLPDLLCHRHGLAGNRPAERHQRPLQDLSRAVSVGPARFTGGRATARCAVRRGHRPGSAFCGPGYRATDSLADALARCGQRNASSASSGASAQRGPRGRYAPRSTHTALRSRRTATSGGGCCFRRAPFGAAACCRSTRGTASAPARRLAVAGHGQADRTLLGRCATAQGHRSGRTRWRSGARRQQRRGGVCGQRCAGLRQPADRQA